MSPLDRRKFLETAGSVAVVGSGAAALAAATARAAEEVPGQRVKILGICCSPRKGKTTAAALQVCLDAAKAVDRRIEVDILQILTATSPQILQSFAAWLTACELRQALR